ncbi:hypothetical protein [Vibrio crassostreae]|uniref:hypothetical protein n=1 Tax=Vibrio crassostreae TaxID=246167 RepID=UPI001B30BDB8|nr:hypothetical protein [Vibrio crassostreae]
MKDKLKLVASALLLFGMLTAAYFKFFGGSEVPQPRSNGNNGNQISKVQHDETTKGDVQSAPIEPTTITVVKEPEVLTLEALPVMTAEDLEYIKAVKKNRILEFDLKAAKNNQDIARAKAEQQKYSNQEKKLKGETVSPNVRITGGKTILPEKTLAPRIATPSTVVNKTNKSSAPNSFYDINVNTVATSAGKTTVWLNTTSGLLPISEGLEYGYFRVEKITPEFIHIVHVRSKTSRYLGTNTSVSLEQRPSNPQITEPVFSNSVEAIRQSRIAERRSE